MKSNYGNKCIRFLFLLLGMCLFEPCWGDQGKCELSDWYVGKEGVITDWPGDFDKASKSSNYYLEQNGQFNRALKIKNPKANQYLVATLTADRDYDQGLSVPQGNVKLRLNGKVLTKYQGSKIFYKMPLKKGVNTFEMMVPAMKTARKHQGVFMTLVDLEFIYPEYEKSLEDLRLSVANLAKEYPDYKTSKYSARMKKLEQGEDWDGLKALRYEALVTDNPMVDFDEIIFRRSQSDRLPANWRGNSEFTRRDKQVYSFDFGDSIERLNLRTGKTKEVYKPKSKKESLMDINLDYEAGKFLYSAINTETTTSEIYEMNIDGSGKRQLTTFLDEVDNYNAVYLPSGKIIYCSTASLNSVPCVRGKDYVGTLFEMEGDGSKPRMLTFDQENVWYPWVKENGKVQYSRWEYTDNSHYFTRILMEMNPDGTDNRSVYGSNSYWPNTLFYAKQIPGKTSQFSAIVSGHHGAARQGELWVFDQSLGSFEAEGAMYRIPGRGRTYEPRIIDKYVVGKWPMFLHPYPLGDGYFVVSGKMNPNAKWSLYLVDKFDNIIQLGESRDQMFEPIPLKKRNKPPVIPSRRDPNADDANLYIQNIYAGPGLEGIPEGEIGGLRLFTYGYAYRDTGNHDALAIEGGWDMKRVLGTVPVEKDGSVMVKIPHSMPISIQPLDKDGNAMQVMRSWLTAQPGETVSCVGCHEPSNTAPQPHATLASKKAPVSLKPWSDQPIHGFGFKREIQPVLDQYCVGCHDGSSDTPNFADNVDQKFGRASFSGAYMALHPYVRRPGPESDLHILTPMDVHTSTSELFQILEKGHHGVELSDEALEKLVTWADLNVPYHATWTEFDSDPLTLKWAKRTVEYKKRFANIDDDIEWVPALPTERPSFVKPPKQERPEALTHTNWPIDFANHKVEKKTIKFGDSELELVRVPAGEFVMGSVDGERDEFPQSVVKVDRAFWMSTTEVTNAQLREFNPEHNSRHINQQWKDHIFPGYPANDPQMPAIRVTWNDAMGFASWLGEQSGQTINLPTEAQWEWAARAGNDQPFFFGTTGFENYANLADTNIGDLAVYGIDPQPLPKERRTPLNDFVPRDESFDDGRMIPDGTGQYKANAFGLYDMIGNVAEWTRTSYKSYPYNEADGRNDLSKGDAKVVRGGSWRDRPHRATSSYRLKYAPYQKVYNVGFRVIIED
ncbi:SUMF1/EgtB/PvdO family nonheme iron enzyme [Persicirhabdus sediminis]|uniref:SUMF1/EgtB/PvdO family nonheme iron enzyme n=2 Tax=Persicirhabdus sediminis TaxID=454144 RepID=A0A8J7SJ39_9BACT|nr:SUMF1/EgtB/PvdO family nonheme iron enzyme [Persicirhabdus sediminis]